MKRAKTLMDEWRTKFVLVMVPLGILTTVVALSPDRATGAPTAHPSGLTISQAYDQPLNAELTDTYFGIASRIAWQDLDDFGSPIVRNGSVILPATSSISQQIARSNEPSRRALALARFEAKRLEIIAAQGEEAREDHSERLPLNSNLVRSALDRGLLVVSPGSESMRKAQHKANSVLDFAASPRFASANAWRSGIDRDSGKAKLVVETLTDELAASLVAEFGATGVIVALEPRPEVEAQSGGRQNDNSPFYGGALIITEASCSSGFGWASSGTYPMITAGHCAPAGADLVTTPATGAMGRIDANTRENYNDGTGTVYLTGQAVWRGDIALIRMASGKISQSRAYRDSASSSTWNTVRERWYRRAAAGDTYCTSGARTGETCGYVVTAIQQSVRYGDGETVRNVVVGRKTFGSRASSGDSGGAVFTQRPDGLLAAKGIHSGGGGGGGAGGVQCSDSSYCTNIFTDIWDVEAAFPGATRLG